MKADAAIANAIWLATSLPEWARYRHAAADVEATQRQLLMRYLRQNAATEFGQAHDFDRLRCWEDYAERVPLRTYDEFRPWIERIADGATRILTTEPVNLFEPTSGSSGAEKWIPYTKTLQAEYRRAVAVWITQNFINNPRLMGGRAYWSLTPNMPGKNAAGTRIPVGFDADSAYLGGFAERLINLTLATRPALRDIADMERFWHVTLLLLLKCRDLRLISVWHPSYALLLLEHMRRNWSGLLDDLRSGLTLTTPSLQISADPGRTKQLELLGADNPGAIWPALQLISCWGDANAAGCLDDVRTAFPGVAVQPKGLVATEAFVTVPLGALRPLAIRSHFFEFIDATDTVQPAWSLQRGQRYSLVATTGGGLYRYQLRDRIEVTGNFRGVPSLRFLGKEDNVSDYFGEKLAETFVAASLSAVFARHGLAPQFAMLAMDKTCEPPRYALYIQCKKAIPAQLAADLEAQLRRNPHFDLCIRLGQLGRLHVVPLAEQGYEVYVQAMTERGLRLGDIKPTPLSRFTDWSQRFAPVCRA